MTLYAARVAPCAVRWRCIYGLFFYILYIALPGNQQKKEERTGCHRPRLSPSSFLPFHCDTRISRLMYTRNAYNLVHLAFMFFV